MFVFTHTMYNYIEIFKTCGDILVQYVRIRRTKFLYRLDIRLGLFKYKYALTF